MFKELNKNSIKKIILSESQLREVVKDVILEELGSFNNQYKLAEYCVQEAVKMYHDGILTKTIDTSSISNEIKSVTLKLENGGRLYRIDGFDPIKKKAIISIGTFDMLSQNDINRLPNKISHELMHCNIFLKRYYSSKKWSDIDVDTYNKVIEVVERGSGKMDYEFAYALYSTYYDEVNAFVSQVSGEIIDKVENPITVDEFKDLYKHTNSVASFNNNIRISQFIIGISDININNYIIKPFNNVGLNFTINDVKKHCKKIIKVSKEALKDCARNAMIAYDILKERNLIK